MRRQFVLINYLISIAVFVFYIFAYRVANADQTIIHDYKNVFALVNMGCMDNPSEKKIIMDKAMMFNDFLVRVLRVPKSNIRIEGNINDGIDWLKKNSDQESLSIVYHYCPNVDF